MSGLAAAEVFIFWREPELALVSAVYAVGGDPVIELGFGESSQGWTKEAPIRGIMVLFLGKMVTGRDDELLWLLEGVRFWPILFVMQLWKDVVRSINALLPIFGRRCTAYAGEYAPGVVCFTFF